MRHISDGELHAYLDGALDALEAERAEEIRSHLGGCPVCRERLQDEEKLRSAAGEILSTAAPAVLSPPPFEALRELAAAGPDPDDGGRREEARPSRRPRPIRELPLAWAATVVLALGVGWMGGQVWRTMPTDGRLPLPTGRGSATQPSLEDPSSVSVEEAGATSSELGLEPRSDAEVAADPAGGGLPGAARSEALGSSPRQRDPQAYTQPDPTGRAATPVEAQEALSPGVAVTARPKQAQPQPELESGAEADRSLPAANMALEEMPVARRELRMPEAAASEAAEFREATETGDVDPISSRGELGAAVPSTLRAGETPAEHRGITDVEREVGAAPGFQTAFAVPGLKVVEVEWEDWTAGEQGLHVRQLLPSGDTLELRYLGMLMGSDPRSQRKAEPRADEAAGPEPLKAPKSLEASLPPGWNQVVMRWGRGWLVARAPLSPESIRALLRSLY